MEPVTLILAALAALAAGASAGLSDAVSQGVKDAYTGLKDLVLRRVQDTPAGEVAVLEHEKDPEVWSAPLAKSLTQAGADIDPQVLEAAQRLLQLTDPDGTRAGIHTVNIAATGDRSIAAHTIHGGAHTGDTTSR